jgi:protein TonB
VWAFTLSLTLHAVSMLLPSPWVKPSVQELARSVLTAHLLAPPEPAPPPKPAAEEPAVKTKVEEPMKAELAKPRPPPRPKERPVEKKKPEPLAGQQLDDALAQLADKLLYPPEAIRRGLEGEAVLVLDIAEGGRIAHASVVTTSGHPVLDQAALRAVKQVGALSPMLAGRSILLPVRFRLL